MFPIAFMHFFIMVLLFERLLFFLIMCVYVWISAHECSACRSQKKMLGFLKLKLHMVVMYGMGAGNQTQVLCKSSIYSSSIYSRRHHSHPRVTVLNHAQFVIIWSPPSFSLASSWSM